MSKVESSNIILSGFGKAKNVLIRRAQKFVFKKITQVVLWKLDGGRWEVWERKQGSQESGDGNNEK